MSDMKLSQNDRWENKIFSKWSQIKLIVLLCTGSNWVGCTEYHKSTRYSKIGRLFVRYKRGHRVERMRVLYSQLYYLHLGTYKWEKIKASPKKAWFEDSFPLDHHQCMHVSQPDCEQMDTCRWKPYCDNNSDHLIMLRRWNNFSCCHKVVSEAWLPVSFLVPIRNWYIVVVLIKIAVVHHKK
jgi:hypothetical protein